MQDCESVENVGTADRSVERVADVEVDVARKVDGETNGVPLAVVVVGFACVFVAVVAAVVAAEVNAVDAKSVDVATAADFELDVLDGIPGYPT